MMEAASTSETSVNFYQTTWYNSPGDSHLHEEQLPSPEKENSEELAELLVRRR
jgi:hypothetical protein